MSCLTDRLSFVFMSRSTQNRSFWRRRKANLLAWYGKLNLTQQKHTFNNQKKCITTQNKHKNLKPGLVASYDIQPGNVLVSALHKLVTYLLT